MHFVNAWVKRQVNRASYPKQIVVYPAIMMTWYVHGLDHLLMVDQFTKLARMVLIVGTKSCWRPHNPFSMNGGSIMGCRE